MQLLLLFFGHKAGTLNSHCFDLFRRCGRILYRHPMEPVRLVQACFGPSAVHLGTRGDCHAMLCGKARTNKKHPNYLAGMSGMKMSGCWFSGLRHCCSWDLTYWTINSHRPSLQKSNPIPAFGLSRISLPISSKYKFYIFLPQKIRPYPTFINTYGWFLETRAS